MRRLVGPILAVIFQIVQFTIDSIASHIDCDTSIIRCIVTPLVFTTGVSIHRN